MKFDMPTCGGCSTCGLACAFHHTGEFNPGVSSLQVIAKEEGSGFEIRLSEENDEKRLACDACKNLAVPLCMEYCKEIDDLGKILQEFEQKRNTLKETD